MLDFTKIIEIRDRKLNDIRKREKRAFADCNLVRNKVKKARKEMEEFAERIRTLEVDLIKDLLETEITVFDIDELKLKLKSAENKAHRLVEDHAQAEQLLAQAEKKLEQIRGELRTAQSKLNKITELDSILADERKELSVAAEDAQIDEFVETMRSKGGPF
jgi:chromosome segregation ATPase